MSKRTVVLGGLKRHSRLALFAGIIAMYLVAWSIGYFAKAANLGLRSVTISTAQPGVTAVHAIQFIISSNQTVGSISLEYCSNTPSVLDACSVPAGLDLTGATLSAQTGATGFVIHGSSNASRIILSRAPAAAGPGNLSYTLTGVINPTTVNRTTFIRIQTFASSDASGPRTDQGAVAFSITQSLTVSAFVPPFLILCVGVTVAADCSSTDGEGVDLGNMLPTRANVATTQFAGATNDVNGYTVAVAGTTMTAGTNTIAPLNAPTVSLPGIQQFGINLRANTSPVVGLNRTGLGTAVATAPYNTPNFFKFQNGETIAASPLSTQFNRFTVSYLVNIPSNQAPGVYASTMTYIGTASF